MPCHMNSSTRLSGQGWGKAGFKPSQKICLYIVKGAYTLESTEGKSMGYKNSEIEGFFSLAFYAGTGPTCNLCLSKQSLLICTIIPT